MTVALLVALASLCWPSRAGRRASQSLVRAPDAPQDPRAQASARARVGQLLTRLAPWRRATPAGQDLLPLLDALAAALRAGLPPAAAVSLAAEGQSDGLRAVVVRPVLDAARAGRPTAAAWERAARARGGVELAAVARAVALSEHLGAPLADAVAGAAQAVRARREMYRRLQTATAGARATAALLTALPLGGLGVAATMGVGPTELYGSPAALASLLLGLLLLALGRLIVHRLIRRVGTAPP